ncbi:MAG: hypothetical protein CYPHOPRED_000730 [Cyphobasidiales sp. Tagirdzhanova-0007]|nr:MAG: hypothetical protein CYPHOPRED_000730 [Cyphobasidiales sp. Tagirdzhanova-0007]
MAKPPGRPAKADKMDKIIQGESHVTAASFSNEKNRPGTIDVKYGINVNNSTTTHTGYLHATDGNDDGQLPNTDRLKADYTVTVDLASGMAIIKHGSNDVAKGHLYADGCAIKGVEIDGRQLEIYFSLPRMRSRQFKIVLDYEADLLVHSILYNKKVSYETGVVHYIRNEGNVAYADRRQDMSRAVERVISTRLSGDGSIETSLNGKKKGSLDQASVKTVMKELEDTATIKLSHGKISVMKGGYVVGKSFRACIEDGNPQGAHGSRYPLPVVNAPRAATGSRNSSSRAPSPAPNTLEAASGFRRSSSSHSPTRQSSPAAAIARSESPRPSVPATGTAASRKRGHSPDYAKDERRHRLKDPPKERSVCPKTLEFAGSSPSPVRISLASTAASGSIGASPKGRIEEIPNRSHSPQFNPSPTPQFNLPASGATSRSSSTSSQRSITRNPAAGTPQLGNRFEAETGEAASYAKRSLALSDSVESLQERSRSRLRRSSSPSRAFSALLPSSSNPTLF